MFACPLGDCLGSNPPMLSPGDLLCNKKYRSAVFLITALRLFCVKRLQGAPVGAYQGRQGAHKKPARCLTGTSVQNSGPYEVSMII